MAVNNSSPTGTLTIGGDFGGLDFNLALPVGGVGIQEQPGNTGTNVVPLPATTTPDFSQYLPILGIAIIAIMLLK
jgi:hypothetical protein